MRAIHRAHSCDAARPERLEAIPDPSDLEETLRALAGHVVSKNHPPKEKRPMRTETTVPMSQVASGDSIASIPR